MMFTFLNSCSPKILFERVEVGAGGVYWIQYCLFISPFVLCWQIDLERFFFTLPALKWALAWRNSWTVARGSQSFAAVQAKLAIKSYSAFNLLVRSSHYTHSKAWIFNTYYD